MFPATSLVTQTFTAIELSVPELITIRPPTSRGVGFIQTRSNVGRAPAISTLREVGCMAAVRGLPRIPGRV